MTEQEYLKRINNSIAEIQSIDFSKGWAYEKVIESILNIEKIPIILHTYSKDNFLFRSRVNNGSSHFDSKSEITAPKEKYVIDYARANKPRQTLFYGSQDRLTSYAEFVKYLEETTTIGEEVIITIGKWKLLKDLTLVLVFSPTAPRTNKYSRSHGKVFDIMINQIPIELRKGSIKFFEFIGNEFSKQVEENSETYLITCAYSNIVFTHAVCDGIIYPSVPSEGKGFNIALRKEIIIENHIQVESARMDKFVVRLQKNGKRHFDNVSSMNASKLLYDTIEWNRGWRLSKKPTPE